MLTVDQVRLYAKDVAELNVLLEGNQQSSDELINFAMELAVNDANIVAPVTSYTVQNFPSDTVMLYGILHHLANSEAERQLRNQINYSAQGLNAGIDDKFEQYTRLAAYYKQLFEQKLRDMKTYINQEKAWGGSWSPYGVLNEYQYRD